MNDRHMARMLRTSMLPGSARNWTARPSGRATAMGAPALAADPALAKGLNVLRGRLVSKAVAEGVGMDYVAYEI